MAISQVVATTSNGIEYNTIPPNRSTLSHSNGGSAARVSNGYLNGVDVSRYDAGVFGSTVINGTNTDQAVNGAFAHNNTSPIATRLYGVMTKAADFPALTQSIHKITTYRTTKVGTAIRTGHWNRYNGKFDNGYPVTVSDNFGNDVAASPTRNVPGVLVYKTSAASIVGANYSKKTG